MIPFLAFAQTEPSMLGIWKGVSNSAVYGDGHFHPIEDDMEKSIRFRKVEYIMTVVKEQGRNFGGYISASNTHHSTDIKHKEMILGSYSKDMKSGVMVNETGSFSFKLARPDSLEICFSQVPHVSTAAPIVASCFEMTKQ